MTSAAPRRYAVIGDPVAHSLSPAMHRAAFEALDLPHTYVPVRVRPDELAATVQAVRGGTFHGLNVTVPHKVHVLGLVDAVDASAAGVGAANTLVREADGRVTAYNTDAAALALELRDLLGPLDPGRVRGLVLGSGGAARAAVTALRSLGAGAVAVRARSAPWEARDPCSALVASWQPWAPSDEFEAGALVVVQATSAGMTGAASGEAAASAVAWPALPGDAVALDAVYAPPETPFLRAARARGLRAANGLGWLARQGALAFELWLGMPAPREAMRAALGR